MHRLALTLLLTVGGSAAANECESYQDMCDRVLGEALRECVSDYPNNSSAVDACKRTRVRAWSICWEQSSFQCSQAPNTGGGNQQTESFACPPGSRPGPLGLCVAEFRPRELAPGVGGCPDGERPGSTGRCEPNIRVRVVPHADGYYFTCPRGQKPSALGLCSPDFEQPDLDNDCPGQAGPDDFPCAPRIRRTLDEQETELTLRSLGLMDRYGRLPWAAEEAGLLRDRIGHTPHLDRVYESVSRAFDAELIRFD